MTRTRREFLRTGGLFAAGSFLAPSLLTNMEQEFFPPAGAGKISQLPSAQNELNIKPSPTSLEHDFDFHIGEWKIHNKRLKTILSNSDEWIEFESSCETFKNLNGFGNINLYRFHKQGVSYEEGLVMRLFNPKTRLWTIYWVESNSVALDVPVIGSFEKKVGTFFANDTFKGQPIIIRCIYDGTVPKTVVWRQAFSADQGETFETNWIMTAQKQA